MQFFDALGSRALTRGCVQVRSGVELVAHALKLGVLALPLGVFV